VVASATPLCGTMGRFSSSSYMERRCVSFHTNVDPIADMDKL
jgi:hypothetical protein